MSQLPNEIELGLPGLQTLPGEEGETLYPEEARQWVVVYSELLAFTKSCLDRLEASAPESVAPEWRGADRTYLEQHRWQLQARLDYWQQRCWELGGIDFNPRARLLKHAGQESLLSPREARLFQFFLDHPGKYFSAQQLLVQAWHSSELAEAQLRSYIVRLRRRIGLLGLPCSIDRRAGIGYALILEKTT